jgi:hypothetical protein
LSRRRRRQLALRRGQITRIGPAFADRRSPRVQTQSLLGSWSVLQTEAKPTQQSFVQSAANTRYRPLMPKCACCGIGHKRPKVTNTTQSTTWLSCATLHLSKKIKVLRRLVEIAALSAQSPVPTHDESLQKKLHLVRVYSERSRASTSITAVRAWSS